MSDTVVQREIVPRGRFSLAAAASFGFGPNEGRPPPFDGAMRLAFAVDGGTGHAGAILRQPQPDGAVAVELWLRGGADPDVALAQVARVISLDHDGREFEAVGERDPVIGRLQAAHPGQRPVLFHSPYEAAAWSIISTRVANRQAAATRDALAAAHGESFELAGRTLAAFPQPAALAALGEEIPGLHGPKPARLQGVARAALDGRLDAGALQALGPEAAYAEVQTLKGLGPFYAGLVMLRATGFADATLPMAEPKVLSHAQRFYGRSEPPTLEQFTALTDRWRPFRTWCMVLVRLAGDRGTSA